MSSGQNDKKNQTLTLIFGCFCEILEKQMTFQQFPPFYQKNPSSITLLSISHSLTNTGAVTQRACRDVVADEGDVPPSNSCHILVGYMSKPERGEEQFKTARDTCDSSVACHSSCVIHTTIHTCIVSSKD